MMKAPMSAAEMRLALNLSPKSRQAFTKLYLTTLLDGGLIEPLYPDSPRHPKQKYKLTEKGSMLAKVLNQ